MPSTLQVVTPVRATCAQALGMVVRQMEQQHVEMVVTTLLKLAAQEQWEVRHASLMGIQHLLAARTVSIYLIIHIQLCVCTNINIIH